jgi:hypothetical protein
MRKLVRKLHGRLPMQFRVLFSQFLLRVIDLEALSIRADVIGFLGQFAGILIMLSLILSAMAGFHPVETEQTLMSLTMLVVGLITVITWDATFPDRRDILILAPLPVRPRTILAAKLSASAAVIGLAVLALNLLPSLVMAMALHASYGSVHSFATFWIASLAMVLFRLWSFPAASFCGFPQCCKFSPSRIFYADSSCCRLCRLLRWPFPLRIGS